MAVIIFCYGFFLGIIFLAVMMRSGASKRPAAPAQAAAQTKKTQ